MVRLLLLLLLWLLLETEERSLCSGDGDSSALARNFQDVEEGG